VAEAPRTDRTSAASDGAGEPAGETINWQLSNVFAKLGVNARAAATAHEYQHRLVPSGGIDGHS
jgi:hypothetical protein